MADEVDAALDRLYGASLDEFVAERKAIAAELRRAGRREGAALVAKAPKPSVSAWAINQLARRNRPAVEELLAAGERLAQEQAAALRAAASSSSGRSERSGRRYGNWWTPRRGASTSPDAPPAVRFASASRRRCAPLRSTTTDGRSSRGGG